MTPATPPASEDPVEPGKPRRKRSFVLRGPGGGPTSTAANDEEWTQLKAIAAARKTSVTALLNQAHALGRRGRLARVALEHFGPEPEP